MVQYGFVSHNGIILIGNIKPIGLLLKQTFSNLFNPTNIVLSTEIILLDMLKKNKYRWPGDYVNIIEYIEC